MTQQLLRALVAAKQKNGGQPVLGVEDLAVGFREILGDHGLLNRGHFLRLFEVLKETFDDAPDSRSARTTVFLFPWRVEEEMKRAAAGGQGPSGQSSAPTAPSGPLAEMEEPPFELGHPHGEACPATKGG